MMKLHFSAKLPSCTGVWNLSLWSSSTQQLDHPWSSPVTFMTVPVNIMSGNVVKSSTWWFVTWFKGYFNTHTVRAGWHEANSCILPRSFTLSPLDRLIFLSRYLRAFIKMSHTPSGIAWILHSSGNISNSHACMSLRLLALAHDYFEFERTVRRSTPAKEHELSWILFYVDILSSII